MAVFPSKIIFRPIVMFLEFREMLSKRNETESKLDFTSHDNAENVTLSPGLITDR